MKNTLKRCALLLACSSPLALESAKAANTLYDPGDLVMTFQKTGSSNTVYVNLGNAATLFRGTASGPDAASRLNIINLNSTLTTAFGAGWASDAGIYAGVVGVQNTDSDTQDVVNGDPSRTLYASKSRNAVGTVGLANSTSWNLGTAGDTAMSQGANNIFASNNVLETAEAASLTTISLTSTSQIDDQNPFLTGTIQGTAYGVFSGGVQQAGSSGAFGVFGDAGSVEFALDLYRIVALEGVDGQVAGTGLARRGTFEGTVALGTDGQVSFLTGVAAVPEPSALALSGLAAAALVLRRRRTI